MSRRGDDWGGERRRPRFFRRFRKAALAPWRSVGERLAAIRRDFDSLRAGGGRSASRMRLDETGAFDLDASAFLHGQRGFVFEQALAGRQRSSARTARLFLGLGVLFFLAWLDRLATMAWTGQAILTALEFTPASAAFFLLAFRFGLENYQIRMRRRVTAMEYLTASNGFWPR
jgi:hypothetical protein